MSATIPIVRSRHGQQAAPRRVRISVDKKDELVGWARKFSLFPYPFVTACCAMEFMAVSSTPYDTDRFGAALPRFSPRQSDLLMVVGTITHKQAPILSEGLRADVRAEMGDGVRRMCATRGLLPELRDVAGIDKIMPVDIYVPGCPPRPETVIDGIMRLQDKIARSHHPIVTRNFWRMSAPLLERVWEQLRPVVEASSFSAARSCCAASSELLGTVRRLGSEFAFDLLLDVTAVDWPAQKPRFEVVYHLYSTTHHVRVRSRHVCRRGFVSGFSGDVVRSAGFAERECHDMYGIVFRGNPDLRPILLYEGFVGHPLRKDYPKEQEQPLVRYRTRKVRYGYGPTQSDSRRIRFERLR
jgi:NADH-quinone oxidoreductase subunit B